MPSAVGRSTVDTVRAHRGRAAGRGNRPEHGGSTMASISFVLLIAGGLAAVAVVAGVVALAVVASRREKK